MRYRCEASSLEGFVQQLAVSYVANGYWFYVCGFIPKGKNPHDVDRKLVEKYGIDLSKFQRARRKAAGHANLHYLRSERFFVLLATHGEHRFFEEERGQIRDIRKVPIKFGSYSVSFRSGHPHVRIDRETLRDLKAYFVSIALSRVAETIERELSRLPFEPWAPVRRQLFQLMNAINRSRKTAGYAEIRSSCLRLRRKIVRPFEGILAGQTLESGNRSARCAPIEPAADPFRSIERDRAKHVEAGHAADLGIA